MKQYTNSHMIGGRKDARIAHFHMELLGTTMRPISHDMMRIVRIGDTGILPSFVWIVNNKQYTVKNGDYLLFNSSDMRMPLVRAYPRVVSVDTIGFTATALPGATTPLEVFYRPDHMVYIPAEMAKSLDAAFERIVAECGSYDAFSDEAIPAALQLLLCDIGRMQGFKRLSSRSFAARNELMSKIVQYLRANIQEKLTIGDVARRFCVSESLLSKLFREMLDMTFPEYVRSLRVSHVIDLINKGCGILDAALSSGFGSISGFYKSFTAVTGSSPREFFKSGKP